MNEPSEEDRDQTLRDRIIGLGKRSSRKTYYLELLDRLAEVEKKRNELEEQNRLMAALLRDLSEERQRASAGEAKLSRLFHATPQLLAVLSVADGRFVELSDSWEHFLGMSRDDVAGKPITGMDIWPSAQARDRFMSMLQSDSDLLDQEVSLRRSNGERFVGLLSLSPLTLDEGRCAVVEVTDITQRKNAEDALRDSEQKYRGLVDNTLVGIFRSGTDDRFLYVNDALVRIFGCSSAEELLSLPISSRYRRPADRQAFLNAIREKGKLPYYEIQIVTPQGQQRTLATSAVFQDGVISGVNVDITEQKSLEEQLRLAQKMEAVGALAGGIAHDFNNILSAIIGFSELLQMDLASDSPLRTNVEQILKAAMRASQLTHSLLAFSRKQVMTVSEVVLNDLIAQLGKLLVRVIGEDIELRTVLQPQSAVIMADSGQIEQVIMNLATNARDAMPQGGVLTISSGFVEVDAAFCEARHCGRPGHYALITVSDTGAGMDVETRKKMFDPFFTTKELGKGTGLGLAMVYGIVRQHNGFIEVDSAQGKGTTFRIYLPALETAEVKKKESIPQLQVDRGTEMILVAEDDSALRTLSQVSLESFGYTVILAEDGAEAVTKFAERRDEIALVILDMIMPRMSGLEASRAIRKMRPDIKTLFISGYTADKARNLELAAEGGDLVMKPISPRDLVRTVRKILDADNHGARNPS